MTVGDLKEALEDLDDDVEVRVMTQPSYPLESKVDGVVTDATIRLVKAVDDIASLPPEDDPKIVYILEGSQIGYGLRAAWEARGC